MNWEAMGAVGEILGATVVLITLVYLAIQVRYAKLAAADANRLARARGVNDMQLAQLANRDAFLAVAKANGTEDVEELGQTIGKFYNLPANRYCWNNSPYGKALLEESFVRFVDDNMARWRDREGLYSA